MIRNAVVQYDLAKHARKAHQPIEKVQYLREHACTHAHRHACSRGSIGWFVSLATIGSITRINQQCDARVIGGGWIPRMTCWSSGHRGECSTCVGDADCPHTRYHENAYTTEARVSSISTGTTNASAKLFSVLGVGGLVCAQGAGHVPTTEPCWSSRCSHGERTPSTTSHR